MSTTLSVITPVMNLNNEFYFINDATSTHDIIFIYII